MHVREAEIAARMAEREFLMIEPEEMKDRGMEVMDVHLVFHGGEAKLIGCAMHVSTFGASARKPCCKTMVVMVPPIYFTRI
jgi:hypothetical protein